MLLVDSAALLPEAVIRAVAATGRAVARILVGPVLRRRIQRALTLASAPKQVARQYVERGSATIVCSLLVYKHGMARSGVDAVASLHPSVVNLDHAIALGRGVVLVGPHMFGHELCASLIGPRHPVAFVIRRETETETLQRIWYTRLGVRTVLRPDHAGTVGSLRTCLRLLREGMIMAVTPDLLAPIPEGLPVTFMGRPIRLRGGAFWLALHAGAPLVYSWVTWADGRPSMEFSEPRTISRVPGVPPRDTVPHHLEAWAAEFEHRLREDPASWAFWLDRRWAAALGGPLGTLP